MLNVFIVYALAEQQTLCQCEVNPGCTVKQAIIESGILQQHPEIDLSKQSIGIYSQIVSFDDLVRSNDRIEIYRPLIIDPRQARIARVKRERRSVLRKRQTI